MLAVTTSTLSSWHRTSSVSPVRNTVASSSIAVARWMASGVLKPPCARSPVARSMTSRSISARNKRFDEKKVS